MALKVRGRALVRQVFELLVDGRFDEAAAKAEITRARLMQCIVANDDVDPPDWHKRECDERQTREHRPRRRSHRRSHID